MNTNNPLTEIGAITLAALLIIAAALLDYAGKIDFTAVTFMVTLAAGFFAGNLALKSPSPTQQTQLSDLQSGMQQLQLSQQHLVEQVFSTLPPMTYATQAQPQVTHVADEFPAPLQAVPKQ